MASGAIAQPTVAQAAAAQPSSAQLATAQPSDAQRATARPSIDADDFEAGVFTDSKGLTLRYRLFVPRDYDPSRRYPLVTFLHGNGERGEDNRRQVREGALVWARPENQERHPAFVLAPQCPGNDGWGRPEGLAGYPASSPLGALFELLDDLERRYSIDVDRRYITGMSGGGWGTLRALAAQPQRFAAAILVCPAGEPGKHAGVPEDQQGVKLVEGLAHLPLWFFHGTDDEVVPISLTRARVEALRRAGGKPRLTEYPGVKHDAWVRAYAEPEIVEWLFRHR
jgi:predicted peptidase